MLPQNEAMGAATASDGGVAPIASFWVRIMTSCINIKRGVCFNFDGQRIYSCISIQLKYEKVFNEKSQTFPETPGTRMMQLFNPAADRKLPVPLV